MFRLAQVLYGFVALMLLAPRQALALYAPWETQGSYVHLMAHLLFFGAMLFFIYEIKRGELRGIPGFRCLIWSCWLLAWWNLDAVVGHTLDWTLLAPVVLGKGLERRLLMENWHTWGYYLTQFTHFLLPIPAFYLFYRGLKTLTQDPGPESS